jgi:hypothetical protein
MKKWIYYGVFLDEDSRKEILEKAKELASIPDNWKEYADHMTIVFNDGKNYDTESLEKHLGEEVELKITSIGKSSEAIAFGVDYKTNNKRSHITVACAPGIKPVRSNFITLWKKIPEFVVKGKINVVRPR